MIEQAMRTFPGSTVVSTRTYADFRSDMFAAIKREWGHLPDQDRWEKAFLALSSCAYDPDPLGPWCRQLWDEVSTAYESWKARR